MDDVQGSTGNQEYDMEGSGRLVEDCLGRLVDAYESACREGVSNPIVFLIDCEDAVGATIARAWEGDDMLILCVFSLPSHLLLDVGYILVEYGSTCYSVLLISVVQSRELQEFIPLINQLITKYKQQISPILRQIFMPVCQNILSCVNLPCDPNEFNEVRDRQNLKKCYFMFISSITINSVTDVIASQDAQNLQEVLGTVVHGAVNFPDPSVQKVCYGVLKKFVESWGAGEVLPGFVAYMYEHILPACFLGPLKVNFDLNDGHSFLALGEIAGTLKAMITCRGNEMVAFLQTKYLPSINLPQETTQVFLKTLQESETKILKSYLKGLFTTLRTHSLQS